MNDIVIKAENIGKSYLIGHKSNEKYVALRDVITDKTKGLWSKISNSQSHTNANIEEFWALKNVSFEVKQGERIGIIGRNGAGKSTLLKILSRITEPTRGSVSIKGRVASLLEVGTGFHPELTGRENIFLNGAILGMTRQEIKRKFDEIVDFAEVEKFLDTPVKRYSSGMYVRLAFAVAAHLEPEILVVDEVLAVGDFEFQKKCLGKMEDVSEKEGRTVLFVSHNMAAISSLCKKIVVLTSGKISFEGDMESGINHYLDATDHVKGFADLQNKKSNWWKQPKAFSKLLSIETLDIDDKKQSLFKMGGTIKIRLKFEITEYRKDIEVGIFIYGQRKTLIGLASSAAEGFNDIKTGIQGVLVEMPVNNLMPGEYTIGVWIVHEKEVDDAYENAIDIDIISDNITGNYVDYDRFKGYGSVIRSNWESAD
ncbi:Vitamin B12 import ATP-binding protein BtuD [subsurface metagenome]